MATIIWFTTRENVKRGLDAQETARNNLLTDRAIAAATRDVVHLCHRQFAPTVSTRVFDWPNQQYARPWRLWLNQHELISVDSITSGGVPLTPQQYFLEPANDGPPYRSIEINLADDGAFTSGATHQRTIAIAGLYGHTDDNLTAGTLAAPADAAQASITVDGPASATVGVGSLLRLGTERVTVTGRRQTATGQTLAADLGKDMAAGRITVADASGVAIGEKLLIDAEYVDVIDIAGDSLVVKRAVDGSTLAAHTAGALLYAPRMLTVTRAAAGTTAASHIAGTSVEEWQPPAPVRELTEAWATHTLLQKSSGYARIVGSGEGQREASGRGLAELRTRVYNGYGRKARKRAV